jgi:hypothetical protein
MSSGETPTSESSNAATGPELRTRVGVRVRRLLEPPDRVDRVA